ncbi:Cytosine-specific methyltransferase [Thalictrum thalictroides]|uniref:DNA (cytosine-5-)-methyltransferase n=1 Tax=Thalictrum thalictroides TaxID=46969 RepID=A0A7J6VA03_THATH|nr:Cytosine-specific methyltransferase [Thalictrum thalictroides]
MSTGLCLGAAIAGVNLVTRWSVDFNENACETIKHNHPETKVRCEAAEYFLCLLKIWKKLCERHSLIEPDSNEDEEDKDDCYDSLRVWENLCEKSPTMETDLDDVEESKHDSIKSSKNFDVEKMLDICFGIPDGYKKPGVYFKVRWEGYDSSHDSWEPIEGLSDCPDRVREFVTNGHRTNIFPLPVPDYALSFKEGKSLKPFGRLWWDETVSTVVTRAEPHNQIILHPLQDRVLTIRENARIQGFPDYYRLMGGVKERYKQVGNAVAVPVAQALGYALGMAYLSISGDEPLIILPQEFPERLWFAKR